MGGVLYRGLREWSIGREGGSRNPIDDMLKAVIREEGKVGVVLIRGKMRVKAVSVLHLFMEDFKDVVFSMVM